MSSEIKTLRRWVLVQGAALGVILCVLLAGGQWGDTEVAAQTTDVIRARFVEEGDRCR